MAQYPINYHLTNCNKTAVTSENYTTGDGGIVHFTAKAVDGCYFLPSDGDNNYISRPFNGSTRVTNFNLQKVSASDDNKVIIGDIDGISSDGKYFSKRLTFSESNSGEMQCYLNARGGTPSVKTLKINNNVSGTNAVSVQNDTNFDITLTGDVDGTFTVIPTVTYKNNYHETLQGTMTVNGNVATFSVPVETNDEVTINGTFTPKPKELTITNHVSGTVATYVQNGENFDITLTGNTDGSYPVVPVVSYKNESGIETTGNMDVNGKTATFSVPVATNDAVTITGTFTPETPQKDVPVTYNLTNCTISPQPQTVKTGDTFNANVTPHSNYQLDSCNLIWSDGSHDTNVSVTGGVISFVVPDNCVSITVKATSSIITPVGVNYGAINVYRVTLENLDAFSKQRFFEIKDDTQGIYEEVNLGIYVNRIKRIFTNVPVSGTDTLKCGNYNTGIAVQTPEKDVITLDFGNVELTGLNNNSEDYNAQISVFIPCRGFVAVDSKYIGKTVNLSIKVNVITGDAVAFLSCDGVTFQLETFSLCRDVIYKTGTSELNLVGGEQWDEQILFGLEPYVLITQNQTLTPPVNNTQENVTIGDVSGYAQFENVDLNTVNLLVDEYNRIISELETGVYL